MKKLAVQLIKELTSLSDTIPAGFKGFFAKSSGLFFKNSDGTEKQIATADQIPSSLPANGGNSDTVDGLHATSFLKYDDPIMPTNPFGGKRLYINSIDNAMYAADKKWWVVVTTHLKVYNSENYPKLNSEWVASYDCTGSGTVYNVTGSPTDIVVYVGDTLCAQVTTPTTQYQYSYTVGVITFGAIPTGIIYVYPGDTLTQYLDSPVASTIVTPNCFNGNYEEGVDIPIGYYAKIRIMFNSIGTAGIPGGYPYGALYLSYYYTLTPDSAFIRIYNRNYRPHTIGWSVNIFTNYIGDNTGSNFIQKCVPNSTYGRTILEFIIIGHASHNTRLNEIDWQLDRPNLSENGSTVTKYGVNKLYYALEFWQQLTKRIGLNPDGSATFDKTVQSNETINFDASIEPTQTGSAVNKTSTWMWQYLAQGIKWLRANFANYSLTTHNHTLSSLSEKSYNSLTDKPTAMPSNGGTSDASLRLYANSHKAGENLTTNDIIFLNDTDSKWYKVLVANRLIPMGAPIGICATTANLNATVPCYINSWTTLPTGFTATLHKNIYVNGIVDSATGKFKSAGTITGDLSVNSAYILLGRTGQTTADILQYQKKDFIVTNGQGACTTWNGLKYDASYFNGLLPEEYAKIDTAFTAHMNIPNNNADCAVFVLNSHVFTTDIGAFISNDYTLPQGTNSSVLILQPGIYEINTAIDFNSNNIKAIIGLCPDSTIINVADTDLISNLELIENLTIKLADSSGTLLNNDSLPKAEARHLKIKHVGSSTDDIEAKCFDNYTLIDDCNIEGIIGICANSKNISNIKHFCDRIANYSGTPAINKTDNIINLSGYYYSPIILGDSCNNMNNIIAEFSLTDSNNIICFFSCNSISNIKVFNCDIGFSECNGVSNSIAETDIINTATVGFNTCILLTNCKATAYVGFGGCSKITTSQAIGCDIGFYSSNKITLCKTETSVSYGFDSCMGMTQNEADSYNSCFADMSATYAIADTPNGGFNS